MPFNLSCLVFRGGGHYPSGWLVVFLFKFQSLNDSVFENDLSCFVYMNFFTL